jgi:hypothetical protein
LKRNLEQTIPILVWAFGYVIVVIVLVMFSALPWTFTYLEVGRFVGPIQWLEYLILALFAVAVSLISFLASAKLKKKWTVWVFANVMISLIILSVVIYSFSFVFMPRVLQAGKKIDTFVAENENLGFQGYIENVSFFLNSNVGQAYNKPEASFRIDNQISGTLLDPFIMKIWGVTRAGLIVYQGWGTCGQASILIEELLHRVGYETRQAFFKGIDHQWTEVKYNGTWLIVDPWYIGIFAEAQNLKSIKPEFQQASGVEVQYSNGTKIDASLEHGY